MKSMRLFLLLLFAVCLAVSSEGEYSYESSGYADPAAIQPILSRQVNSGIPSRCYPSCDLDSCGGGSCALGGFSKRQLGEPSLYNNDSISQEDAQKLGKRLFEMVAGSQVFSGYDPKGPQPDKEEMGVYIRAVITSNVPYFGTIRGLAVDDSMIAVSDQETFSNQPFQIVSTHMYGCTAIAIISRRGVWMTHLWESYSNGKYLEPTLEDPNNMENSDLPNDPAFKQRVLMFLRGETVDIREAVPNGSANYEPPRGPAIDPNLFNRRSDQTEVFIYTPVKAGTKYNAKGKYVPEDLKYLERYGKPGSEVQNAISQAIGARAKVTILPYKPLNKNIAAEKAMIGQGYRGAIVFQYDPNSDGNGNRAWRLLNEHMTYYKKL